MTKLTDMIQATAAAAIRELDKANSGEGETTGTDFTGNVYVSRESEALWIQVEDDQYHVTNWVSLDFPEYAAHGETLVVAADEDDMRNFDANRKPQPTYCVLANEIDNENHSEEVLYSGLTRAEALSTALSAREMGEPEKYNYYIGRDDQR